MFDFEPFDMDFDGDVDPIDFLEFDYLIWYLSGLEDSEDENDEWEMDEADRQVSEPANRSLGAKE